MFITLFLKFLLNSFYSSIAKQNISKSEIFEILAIIREIEFRQHVGNWKAKKLEKTTVTLTDKFLVLDRTLTPTKKGWLKFKTYEHQEMLAT